MFDISAPVTVAEDPVVMVVDDTDAVREVVSLGLGRHGFEVRAADNGRDAIEVYHELRQQDRDVTVLLDVQMPGLDGPLVLAALQALYPGVRSYFMTGDAGEYTEAELLDRGARRVFAKPPDLSAVAAELRRCAAIPDHTASVAEAAVRGPRPAMARERV